MTSNLASYRTVQHEEDREHLASPNPTVLPSPDYGTYRLTVLYLSSLAPLLFSNEDLGTCHNYVLSTGNGLDCTGVITLD